MCIRDRDKVQDLSFDSDTLSFSVSPVGKLTLQIVEREPSKCVKLETTNSPLPFNMWIQLVATEMCIRNRYGEERRNREWVRAFAAKPRIEEWNTVWLVVFSVRLSADSQCLTITLRKYTTVVFTRVQQVGYREVGKLQAQLTDNTRLSPTCREFHLVDVYKRQL